MAGRVGRPALSAEEHIRRGRTSPSDWPAVAEPRPGDAPGVADAAPAPVTPAVRAATLKGLPPVALEMATALLDVYGDFDASALFTVRCYALSCARLTKMFEARSAPNHALYEESLLNLELRRALRLEG